MSFRDKLRRRMVRHAPTLFALARTFAPVLTVKDTTLVFRGADVRALLEDDDGYGVTYGPRMKAITEGENFFLGMDPDEIYREDVENMRRVMPPEDLPTIIAPMLEEIAEEVVSAHGGDIDVSAQLGNIVPARFVARYMGVTGPTEPHLVEWTNRLFQYLFVPSTFPFDERLALRYGEEFAARIDELIATRKAGDQGAAPDDSITRCLRLQAEGAPRMDDQHIRNNLMGIIIGCIPTTSKCVSLTMDYLLEHPETLAGAQAAARDHDLDLLRQYMLESIRLHVFSPAMTRTSLRDQTFRGRRIPEGRQVIAFVQSAMLDPADLPEPKRFRLDRPLSAYLHWGHGTHTCFGAQLNLIQIPIILGALLRQESIERAPDVEGSMTLDGFIPSQMRVYHAVAGGTAAHD